MNRPLTAGELTSQNEALDASNKTIFGFWLYIMTDCVLFATLFATYAVLHGNTFGGPGGKELFNPNFVLIETLILLSSSFTCGLALLAARAGNKRATMTWLSVTLLLGLSFLTMEVTEFRHLAAEGNSWRRSGFLSAFFTLVGTHGAHITAGLIWGCTLLVQLNRHRLQSALLRKLALFSIFWHFLDVVWIFIFTIVYLMGAL